MEGEKALAKKRRGLRVEPQPGRGEPPLSEAQETEVLLFALKITRCAKPGSIRAPAPFAYVTHLGRLSLPGAWQHGTCVG